MHNIELALTLGNFRLFMQRRADPKFEPIREKVLRRDGHTCYFCGFQAKLYQEIINIDNNYYHNKVDNLATACCFCTQSLFLESVGSGFGGGRLIYMPEMSQVELNSFCHVTFCAMTNASDYRNSAQTIYRTLKFRSQPIDTKFGEGASNPAIFCQMLMEQEGDIAQMSKTVFKDMRLLPAYPKFKTELEAWAKAAAEELAAAA
jgi:intracellular multiplication protein IcmJ